MHDLMKSLGMIVQKIFYCLIISTLIAATIFSQTTDDYRSAQTGNWNSTSTWQRYSGSTWVSASVTPNNSNANNITILAGHTVTITANVTADQIIINANGQVIVNPGAIWTINNGTGTDLAVNGTVQNSGSMSYAPTTVVVDFGSGSTYRHAKDAGGILTATWNNNSTCEVTGTVGTLPFGFDQTLGNLIWNCAGQTTSTALGDPFTINGNFTLLSTGSGQFTLPIGTSTVAGILTLTGGIIKTSSTNLLTLGSSATVSGGSSSSFVDGPMRCTGTGNKTFPIGKGASYRPVTLGSIAGTSLVLQAEVFNSGSAGTPGTGLNLISSVRHWQISISGGTFTSSTVNLKYDTDDGVTDAANLRIAQASTLNGTYANRGGTGSSNISGNITSNSVSTLGFFTLANATGGTNPLPVELISFSASVSDYSVRLIWETATEVNNYGFGVERSTDKINWGEVAFINGNGNSNSPKQYSYVDSKVSSGKYYYRLKQMDNDGAFDYSKEIETSIVGVLNDFVIEQNFPNPFNPATTIKFGFNESVTAKVIIYNALGSEITTLFNDNVEPGKVYSVDFDGSHVASGVYYYSVSGGNYNSVKKMILTK